MDDLVKRLRHEAETQADIDGESKWERLEWKAATTIDVLNELLECCQRERDSLIDFIAGLRDFGGDIVMQDYINEKLQELRK